MPIAVIARWCLATAFYFVPASGAAADEFIPKDKIISDPESSILDPEFDVIDNFMVWQDHIGNLWLSRIDPVSGDISPKDGKGTLLDSGLASGLDTGNGPEWGYTYGTPVIAYTKSVYGTPMLARARQDADGDWMADRLNKPLNRARPEGTHPSHNGPMRIAYNHTEDETKLVSWRDLQDEATEQSIHGQLPQGGRWLEGTDFMMSMEMVDGVVQVAMTDIEDGEPQVVTQGSRHKLNAFGWWAPELNEPLFSVMMDAAKVTVFRQWKADLWLPHYTLDLPTDKPYVSSPEAFTVNGKSYIVVVAAEELGTDEFKFQPNGPSEIWIAGIDPDNPFYRRVDDPKTRAQRSEPEVYPTPSGPVVFYTEKDTESEVKLLRRADTGLGPDQSYDMLGYGGPWATMFRDNTNCNCTPFPIASEYEEQNDWKWQPNRQNVRQLLGPKGQSYTALLEVDGTPPPEPLLVASDAEAGTSIFELGEPEIASASQSTHGLIDSNGNLYFASKTHLYKFDSDGNELWKQTIKGLPRSLQRAPDGGLIFFTWNGWAHVADPSDGTLKLTQELTPGRTFPPDFECLKTGVIEDCAYIDAPAIDPDQARVYQTLTTVNGNGVVQAYRYTPTPPAGLVLDWTSAELTGNVTSPVLAADYERIYVQDEAGLLTALDAETGEILWSLPLDTTVANEPAVTSHGFIMPGGRINDTPNSGTVGILKDNGSSAEWAFRSLEYTPASFPAAGRGNRFVLAARRKEDDRLALLVVHPTFGIMSETLLGTNIPDPGKLTGITLRNDGWVFLGTTGKTTRRAYRPIFDLSLPTAK